MLMESHSPIDLVVLMLGINDFQDCIGASARDSAEGLALLVDRIQALSPEPMKKPANVLVIIPPDIQQPLQVMAEKFSGFSRGRGASNVYKNVLADRNVSIIDAEKYIHLSKVDGVHLDEPEHIQLAQALAVAIVKQQ